MISPRRLPEWRDWAIVALSIVVVALGIFVILRSQQVSENQDRIDAQARLLTQTCLSGNATVEGQQYSRRPVKVSTPDGSVSIVACVRNS